MTPLPVENSSEACAGCGRTIEQPQGGGRRKWCSDRCRKDTLYRTYCEDCGKPLHADGMKHRRCRACSNRHSNPQRTETLRRRWAPHRARIEAMWADGKTQKEIREALGIASFSAGPYRAHGYDLPYRYAVKDKKRVAA